MIALYLKKLRYPAGWILVPVLYLEEPKSKLLFRPELAVHESDEYVSPGPVVIIRSCSDLAHRLDSKSTS
jgi:hypothetical protein